VSSNKLSLHVCFFYLPPANSKVHEQEWMDVVATIDVTLSTLEEQAGLGTRLHVILTGDANFQPASLSAGAAGHPKKDRRGRLC
jgi:hypothetical protein